MAMVIKADAAGIYKKEIDQSNNIAVAGTSVGGLVIRAPMGPVNREVIVPDYPTFVDIFGGPIFVSGSTPVYGYGPYAAEVFLNESNELHVIRVTDSADKYPMARFTSAFDEGSTWNSGDVTYAGISANMTPDNPDTVNVIQALDAGINTGDKLLIGALGPGLKDQNIGVTVESFNMSADWMLNYDDYPTASAITPIIASATAGLVPSVAVFSAALLAQGYNLFTDVFPVATKVIKISVYTKTDNQTWADINSKIDSSEILISDLVPVETFYGTIGFVKDAKNNQLRLIEQINGKSQYIYIALGNAQLPCEILPMNTDIFPLSGGAISTGNGLGDTDGTAVLTGWEFFRDREYATINILDNFDWNTAVKQKVAQIAATRMDCISVGQSGGVSATSVEQVLAQEKYGYVNPSYIGLYAGWDLKYDQANDRNLYIPKAIYGASLFARVDRTGQTWDAPAGDPNGILPTQGQNKVFKFTDIGLLQRAGINTSRFLRSTGHTMWGQRTAQIKDTALNRINVRRLLIYIENSVELTMFPFLFNIVNDDKQRLRVSTLINNFLGGIKAAGGVTDAQAVCTDKNNTPAIIDASQMVVDIFVIPSKPVEVIQINTRIMKTGVNFNEIIL